MSDPRVTNVNYGTSLCRQCMLCTMCYTLGKYWHTGQWLIIHFCVLRCGIRSPSILHESIAKSEAHFWDEQTDNWATSPPKPTFCNPLLTQTMEHYLDWRIFGFCTKCFSSQYMLQWAHWLHSGGGHFVSGTSIFLPATVNTLHNQWLRATSS